jgi:hypothetical protein
VHNDTDHQIRHPAVVAVVDAVVELVEPGVVAAAGKNRKPWSK